MKKPDINTQIPLAIVGLACRLPGSTDLDAYWELIRSGGSAIGELPESRFNRSLYYNPERGVVGKSYSSLAGLMPPADPITDYFHLSPSDIAVADPAHLQLVPVAADAFRMAGLDPRTLTGQSAGVYVGHTRGSDINGNISYESNLGRTVPWLNEIPEFSQSIRDSKAANHQLLQRLRAQIGADPFKKIYLESNQAGAVISRAFGFDGPFAAINAACASSLMALTMGSCALANGDIDLAVIGGASSYRFDCSVLFSKAQSVSGTGSRPFDDTADGLIAAEGIVMVLVKTLEKALSDGNTIHAVIPSIGISSDGRGKAVWAPRVEGQIEALKRAYPDAGMATRLQYIEAHATSTQLGDATELNALNSFLKECLPAGKKIPIGSVKANIGHTLEVAGLAGLVKTAMALKHQTIPPVINVNTPNSQLAWNEIPFELPRRSLPWEKPEDGSPRLAGVNSFGIGGCNAHVVLEEHLSTTSRATAVPVKVRSDDREPIAVVGMSVLSAGANNLEQFKELIASGDSAIGVPRDERCEPSQIRTSKINEPLRVGALSNFEYDWKRHKIPPKQIAAADPLQFMLLDAADRALEPLLSKEGGLSNKRTAAIVGAIPFGDFAADLQQGLRFPELEQELREYLAEEGVESELVDTICEKYFSLILERMPALADETGSFTSSSLATRITKSYDLMGGALAIDAGDCSGITALELGCNLLQNGSNDTVICASGSRQLSLPFFERMGVRGELGADCHPLEQSGEGTVPGEVAVVLVLKRLADAQRDDDRIFGIIRGIGFSRSASTVESNKTAIQRALRNSKIEMSELSAIESASRGISDEDRLELQAITDSIEQHQQEKFPLGTISGQTGYTYAASGLLSAVKSLLELDQLTLNSGLRGNDLLPEVEQGGLSCSLIPTRLRSHRQDGRVFMGVNNTSGQDFTAHLVLERAEPVQDTPHSSSTQDTQSEKVSQTSASSLRTIRCEVDTYRELIDWVGTACDDPQAIWNQKTLTEFSGKRLRLSVLISQPKELVLRLKNPKFQRALNAHQSLFAFNQVYLRDTESDVGPVAFLFPGQGSQYPNMGIDWLKHSPVAAEISQKLDSILRSNGEPELENLVQKNPELLGKDVWRTQLSVLLMDTILYQVVTQRGFRPERVTGHSFGEYPALLASKSWDFLTALKATRARCQIIDDSAQSTKGMLLSCFEGVQKIRELLKGTSGLFISHLNSPQQTVVGGPADSILNFEKRLSEAGIRGQVLSVPRPFHTPIMKPIVEPVSIALKDLPVGPPYLPFLSGISQNYSAEPNEIRTQLAEQLTEPVNFTRQIERLYDEGVRLFLEVGPGSVLTKLTHAILGTDRNYHSIAVDDTRLKDEDKLVALDALAEIHDVGTAYQTKTALDSTLILDASEPLSHQSSQAPLVDDRRVAIRQDQAGVGLLKLEGSSYEMGLQHGREYRAEIRSLLTRQANVVDSPIGERLPDLTDQLPLLDELFDESSREEIRGIAAGAGVMVESIVAHNLRICPDLLAGCSQFLSKTSTGGWIQASNEDLPISLILRESFPRVIFVRHPDRKLPHVTFGIPGQVSGINGANNAGVVVTSAMLLDQFETSTSARGRLHPIIVRELLQSATTIEEAIEFLRSSKIRGGWGVCLSHATSGEACYVEYNEGSLQVRPISTNWSATNHSLLIDPVSTVPQHSQTRYDRLRELLNQHAEKFSVERSQEILHDRYHGRLKREPRFLSMETIRRVDNEMSFVYDSQSASISLAARSANTPDEYYQWDLKELIDFPAVKSSVERADRELSDTLQSVIISREEYRRLSSAPPESSDICARLVGRLVPALPAIPAKTPLSERGATLILGKNNVSQSIESELRQRGCEVFVMDTTLPIEDCLTELDAIWNRSPVQNLIIATPFDADSLTTWEQSRWDARMKVGVLAPYQVLQKWYTLAEQQKTLDNCYVFSLARLGGHFGFGSGDLAVESGAMSGLLKGMGREYASFAADKLIVRGIDFAPDLSDGEIVAQFIDEIGLRDPLEDDAYYVTEVVRTRSQRYDVRCIAVEAPETELGSIAAGGTWVVTGGARGITAEIAKGIARQGQAKLHLLGSSPLPSVKPEWVGMDEEQLGELRKQVIKDAISQGIKPPVIAWERVQKALEIDRNIREMKEMGAEVTYHVCDLTQPAQLSEVLNGIRSVDGPIRGIVHGAGYEKSTRFSRKNAELVERTIATKVEGAYALMSLTREDPLEYFLGFGSISGRFGGIGQTDYAAANDMLCKLISWYRGQRPEVHSAALGWHSWGEVGMAARPETQALKNQLGWRFLPVAEGVRHFLNEWFSSCPEPEVVITDWHYYKRLHPDESEFQLEDELRQPSKIPHYAAIPPAAELDSNRAVFKTQIDPIHDEFLSHHVFRDRPIFPMVMASEFLVAAASSASGGGTVRRIENLEVENVLKMLHDNPHEVEVTAELESEGNWKCQLSADLVNRSGITLQKRHPRFSANVVIGDRRPSPKVDLPFDNWSDLPWKEFGYPEMTEQLNYGTAFHACRSFAIQDKVLYTRAVSVPRSQMGTKREGEWLTSAAVLDATMFAGGVVYWFLHDGLMCLPIKWEHCEFYQELQDNETCYLVTKMTEKTDVGGKFDIQVFNEQKELMFELCGYRNIEVPETEREIVVEL